MLTIICGEDIINSRNYLNQVIQDYRNKGYDVNRLESQGLDELPSSVYQSFSLFNQKSIFLIENLNKLVGRRKSLVGVLEEISKLKEIELIDWEDGVSQRDLKIKTLGKVKEFKLGASIFSLLEACYPSNLSPFLKLLTTVYENNPEGFVLYMLTKHLRKLILAKTNSPQPQLQSWQKFKLEKQAKFWPKEFQLVSFYDRLIGLEAAAKSGKNPLGIKRTVEVLSCYYIK